MTTTALARIDEEIIKQKSLLFDLYTQRNSLSFISRLPTEILETIFIHCARDHHDHAGRNYVMFPPFNVPNWVNVSYVCRHWRDVALDCSTLWSYVFATSLRWTEELLARSKQASLKVQLGYIHQEHWWSSFVEKAMNHTERIRDLTLFISDTGISPLYSKLLSSCAPRLQKISIVGELARAEWSPVLFNGDTPALRTLELLGCPLAVLWNSFKLIGLTTLHVQNVPMPFEQTTEEFLAVLSDMQDLRHLYLMHALASARDFLPSDVFKTFPKINLPRLSRLLVVAPLSTVVKLLSCVNIPPKTELRLKCYCEPDFSNYFTLLSSHLAQRSAIFALSSPPIRSLAIMPCNISGVGFAFSTSEHECSPVISSNNWGCNIPLKIVVHSLLDTRMSADSVDCTTRDMCNHLFLANVQSIDVNHPVFWSAFWKNLLGHLQNLRYIKLSEGYMPNLAPILSLAPHECTENQGGHVDQGPNQLFAPALEELELSNIQFAPEPARKQEFDADLQSLYDALSTRIESRGRLTMTQCSISGGSSNRQKNFDMLGWWMGGYFHMISMYNSDPF